jgi:sigma-B regulation protein RsbU (phosphoserine phosphatase)
VFQLFAELVGFQLAAEAEHVATRSALLDASQTHELREQFIAVLGHDIRTPLQSIAMGQRATRRPAAARVDDADRRADEAQHRTDHGPGR